MKTVLFVIYLLVYIYVGPIFFFSEDFNFTLYNTKTKEEKTKNFCYSSFQCRLFITNYRIRNGGRITD